MTKQRYHSLSRRIVLYFCLFTLMISAMFGLISFVLMYTLEDSFILKDIQLEAEYLVENHRQTGHWVTPRKSNVSLHFSKATFPEEFRAKAIKHPAQHEFYGDEGRHYHLFTIPDYKDTYLVAEVSNDLLVRPIRGGVIQFLLVSGLITSALACFIAWLVARRTTRPLRALVDLVDGVAPEQIPRAFANQYPNNEIGILANALEQSFARIAETLHREKCFTHDVSHELRTPLAIISNAAELLSAQLAKDTPQIAAVDRIQEAAEQMEKTVSTLLILARESHVNSPKEAVDLMAVIERSVLDHSRLLEGKAVDIHIADRCTQTLTTQAGMVKVLLDNLISNAFQYTDQGTVSVDFHHSTLTVQDTGTGIAPSISALVTEPAVKGSQSTGFGFGLSIVKRLCEHQGWTLSVSSEQGTRIAVTF